MIEAVENHMPQVIVIDEIGTTAEAAGRPHHRRARRAAHRHGARQHAREPAAEPDALRSRRRHPGGDALRRGGAAPRHAEDGAGAQGAAHLRRADRDPGARTVSPSTTTWPRWSTAPCATCRRGRSMRVRNEDGGVEIRKGGNGRAELPSATSGPGRGRRSPWAGDRHERSERNGHQDRTSAASGSRGSKRASVPPPARSRRRTARTRCPPSSARPPRGKAVRLLPYAVSKGKLERAHEASSGSRLSGRRPRRGRHGLTLKAQERRQPRRLRDAERQAASRSTSSRATPSRRWRTSCAPTLMSAAPTRWTATKPPCARSRTAIDEVLDERQPVELAPQNNYLRRLQHQVAERYGLSLGEQGARSPTAGW